MKKRIVWGAGTIMGLLAAAVVGGCGSGNGSASTALTRSVTTANGLRLTITEDRGTVAVGQNVHFTLTMTNTTDKPVTYTTEDINCGLEILPHVGSYMTVTIADRALIFGNGDAVCTAASQTRQTTLAAGASLAGTTTSQDLYTTPGTYTQSVTVFGVDPAEPLTFGDLPIVVTP